MNPSRRLRAAVAVLAGLGGGVYSAYLIAHVPGWVPDLDQFWVAARAVRAHQDPYAVVASRLPYPLYYPGPAIVAALPLSFLPLPLARSVFAGLGTALLAYAVTGRGWWMLWLFLSNTIRETLLSVQWSPYLTAAALLPYVGALLPAKPTVGLAVGAAYPSRRLVLAAGAMLALSLVLVPGWPASWWSLIHHGAAHIRPPVTRPFGWLLLLALLRWRRPEARLLVFLGCVPQTSALYETLPLFLVADSRTQTATLALLSYIPILVVSRQMPTFVEQLAADWPYLFLGAYLPALVLVLRRPNVAPVLENREVPPAEAATTAR
jgi:hypothetical protein